MSFSMRNVRKFFDDHPEYGEVREDVVRMADEYAHGNMISGQHIGVLGTLFPQFRSELLTDPIHIEMWIEDATKLSGSPGAIVDMSRAFWRDIARHNNGVVCSLGGREGKLLVVEKEEGWEFSHPALGEEGMLVIYKDAGDTTPALLGMSIIREIKMTDKSK